MQRIRKLHKEWLFFVLYPTKIILLFSPLRGENRGSFEGEPSFFRALGSKKRRFTLKKGDNINL